MFFEESNTKIKRLFWTHYFGMFFNPRLYELQHATNSLIINIQKSISILPDERIAYSHRIN